MNLDSCNSYLIYTVTCSLELHWSMAKRQRLTVEEVLETMDFDFEDDPDEPVMEGSDDELFRPGDE